MVLGICVLKKQTVFNEYFSLRALYLSGMVTWTTGWIRTYVLFPEHISQVVVREKKLPAAIGQQILDVILKPHKHKHRKGRSKQHNKPEIEKSGPSQHDTGHTDQKSSKSGDDNSGHVDSTMSIRRTEGCCRKDGS